MRLTNPGSKPIILQDKHTAKTWALAAGESGEFPETVAIRMVTRGARLVGDRMEEKRKRVTDDFGSDTKRFFNA